MTVIHAEDVKIDFDTRQWRLYPLAGGEKPIFEYTRSNPLMFYAHEFGAQIGLPGDRFSVVHVYAVLVGFHAHLKQWMLGIHCSTSPDATPALRILARWQKGDSQEAALQAREAASGLSVLLSCPLKVFGAKKLPVETSEPKRSGLTGPLTPHTRERIELPAIMERTKHIELPIEGDSFILFRSRTGLILKQGKPAGVGDLETPIFNMCEFNPVLQKLRLVPPTGLLGSFIETAAQEILYDAVLNVELRHTIEIFADQATPKRHIWGIYLTVPHESLLLAQVAVMAGGALEPVAEVVESAAYMIANAISCHMVKTMLSRQGTPK
jgi:hypothetical protein